MREGQVVADRFEVESIAGAGAMGTVFRALDRKTGAMVAIKVLHTADAKIVDRFAREADILLQLHHPFIVQSVASGLTETGERWLAMEWLQGEDLSQRLKRQGLEVHEAIVLARKVALGLGSAHANGIVHRDIKPGNVFLVDGDPTQPRILDFGVARLTDRDQRMTATGAALGTPAYMSPEQAGGGQPPDARSDVFSLGTVLYECIAGQMAFGGDTLIDVLSKILFGDMPRLQAARPDVPPALDAVVARMMAKNRDDRYANGDEAAAALLALESLRGARPLSTTHAPLMLTGAERRFVCIVVISVQRLEHGIGLTVTEEEILAENEALAAATRAFGFRMELIADGSQMAILETSAMPQEMIERTARYALRAQQCAVDAPIAVATGWGVIDHQITLGAVLARATDLLTGCQQPGVYVDAASAVQLEATFNLEQHQSAWRLLGPRSQHGQVWAVLGKPTACVGRQQELALLDATLAQVTDDSEARPVVITGPSGIGKSRLAHEFLARAAQSDQPARVLRARGDQLAAGSPWLMLRQVLIQWLGTTAVGDREAFCRAVRLRLGSALPAGSVDFVTDFIGEVYGGVGDDGSALVRAVRADAALMAAQINKAFTQWVQAVTADNPLIVVLEDAHWGDLPSIRALDSALRDANDRPLLVLAVGRPQLHERFTNLWKDRGVSDVRLGRLALRACERIVQQVLGKDIGAALMAKIVSRAEGNPYCIEELMRHVARGERDTFPDSLLGMVQARLDALPPFDRQVLRAAAVFGQRLWLAGVATLLGGDDKLAAVHDALVRLSNAELIELKPESSVANQVQYEIPSEMVHSAAYTTLIGTDVTNGHRLVAKWLETNGEHNPLILAEHHSRGGHGALAAGYFLKAAEQAQAAHDSTATNLRAQRGLDAGASGNSRGKLLLLLADSLEWQGDLVGNESAARAAEELLDVGSAEWFTAAGGVLIASARLGACAEFDRRGDRICAAPPTDAAAACRQAVALCRGALNAMWVGRPAIAQRWMTRAQAIAREDLNLLATARLHHAQAYMCLNRGDLGAAATEFAEAANEWENAGDLRSCTGVKTNLGYTWARIGDFERAELILREQLAKASKLGLGFLLPVIEHNLATVLAFSGNIADGLALKETAVAKLGKSGHPRLDGNLQASLAEILLLAGQAEPAAAIAQQAAGLLAAFPPTQAYAMAVQASALLQLDRPSEALQVATAAMELFEKLGAIEEGESLLRLTWAQACLDNGQTERGKEGLLAAAVRLEARARALPRALRVGFLSSSPARRKTFELAEAFDMVNA